MKNLTINERINFKSHFKPNSIDAWFFRANSCRFHLDRLAKKGYSSSSPHFVELYWIPHLCKKSISFIAKK